MVNKFQYLIALILAEFRIVISLPAMAVIQIGLPSFALAYVANSGKFVVKSKILRTFRINSSQNSIFLVNFFGFAVKFVQILCSPVLRIQSTTEFRTEDKVVVLQNPVLYSSK